MVAAVIAIAVKTGGEAALVVTVHVAEDRQPIRPCTKHQGPSLDQDLALMTKSVCIKIICKILYIEKAKKFTKRID